MSDIVQFIESEFGVRLFDWQKNHIRTLYENYRDTNIRIVMPRHLGEHQAYIYMNQAKELLTNGKTNDRK